jgi:hypothetical protein
MCEDGLLLICIQTRTLLDDGATGVVLEVEQVLCVLGQLSPPGIELHAGEVTSCLQVLTPLGLLLVPNQEQRDRRVGQVGEVSLKHGDERHVCHVVNDVIQVASNDGSGPWCLGSMGISTRTSQQLRLWA